MNLHDAYAALHRITGAMALLGVMQPKVTKEHVKEWTASLKEIIKEMQSWTSSSNEPSTVPRRNRQKKKRK